LPGNWGLFENRRNAQQREILLPGMAKIAGILCVFQDFLVRHSGKVSAGWAF